MNVNHEVFENRWEQIRAHSKAWWSLLSDDDLNKVANAPIKRDKYAMILRVKYGYTPERVREEINQRITALESNPLTSELMSDLRDPHVVLEVSKVRKSRAKKSHL